jgi:hypothetical protein
MFILNPDPGVKKHRIRIRNSYWSITDPENADPNRHLTIGTKKTVLRIHDIFGLIRIRFRESMPMTNWSVFFHHFCKLKSLKEWHNRRNQGFSYYFCMIEWSWTGSIPLTSGSGSGSWRPRNMWIRIRIHNTEKYFSGDEVCAEYFKAAPFHSHLWRLWLHLCVSKVRYQPVFRFQLQI